MLTQVSYFSEDGHFYWSRGGNGGRWMWRRCGKGCLFHHSLILKPFCLSIETEVKHITLLLTTSSQGKWQEFYSLSEPHHI